MEEKYKFSRAKAKEAKTGTREEDDEEIKLEWNLFNYFRIGDV